MLKKEKQIRLSAVFTAVVGATITFVFSFPVFFSAQLSWSNSWWMLDSFSALMAVLISFVYMAAILVSYRYIEHEFQENIINLDQVKLYFSLISLFAFSMLAAVFANNTILIWLALETTTLSSTFLVGLYKKKTSVEAAWKYIILCSTGITLGLVGVLLVNYSGHLLSSGEDFFSLTFLTENSHLLSPQIIKWAFVFLFIGFGTKVGLVPMHSWLPDAHSKAPSPVSAIFSGILLNVALYVIIRFKHIADGALGGSDWTNEFFLIFGFVSIILPALALLVQNNYKGMLAYSSIEHMGLICLAIALSPLGLAAAFIHMIGHTIIKSGLFFGAGEFLIKWKTTKINKINFAMKSAPYTSFLFLIGILAIVAAPPSLIFFSEYILFSQMFSSHWLLAICVLIALSFIALAMLHSTVRLIFHGEGDNEIKKEKWNIVHTVMLFELMLAFGLSFILISPRGLTFIDSLVKTIN